MSKPGLYKVLLVDDQESFHTNMHFALTDFEIHSAYNEKEAKQLAEENSFDLIIIDLLLDLNSSEFHGLELISHFVDARPGTPIVAVTSYKEQANLREETLKRGAKAFLPKHDYELEDWKNVFESYIKS